MSPATPRLDDLEEEFGIDARAAVQDWSDQLYVLIFQENMRGGDPVAHTFDGKTVFPDKYRGGDQLHVGEPWICDVTSKGGSTFFAAPLVKIDPTFFFELVPEQMDRLVDVAITQHRDALQGIIKAALAKRGDLVAAEQLENLEGAKNEAEAKLAEARRHLEETRAQLREAESRLRVRPENGSQPPDAPLARFVPIGGHHEPGPIHVVRTAEEVLESASFTADHYYGHVSPDGRRLFLKPHPKGNLPCVGGRLQVPGLNRIVAFGGPASLSGHYDPRHGGFFVRV